MEAPILRAPEYRSYEFYGLRPPQGRPRFLSLRLLWWIPLALFVIGFLVGWAVPQ